MDAALGDSHADNADEGEPSFGFIWMLPLHTHWILANFLFSLLCFIFAFVDAGKENDANELDENLDLENFGKKKKKKKKPFNLDELENNLPSADGDEKKDDAVNDVAGDEGGNVENDYDFDLDFMKTKKKKKKKKELDELVAEKTEEQQQTQQDNGTLPAYFIHVCSLNVHQISHIITSNMLIEITYSFHATTKKETFVHI